MGTKKDKDETAMQPVSGPGQDPEHPVSTAIKALYASKTPIPQQTTPGLICVSEAALETLMTELKALGK